MFRYREAIKISTKNHDNTPLPILKIFRYQKFSETERVPSRNVSVPWEKKILEENHDNIPPPSYPQNFSIPDIFWKKKGFSTRCFGTVRQKNRRKIVTPPLLTLEFFGTRNFLKQKGFLQEMFRYRETKKPRRKTMIIPPSYPRKFSIPECFRNKKGSFTKCFGTVRQEKYGRKIVIP